MSSEHPVEWDDATIARLWNYYSRHARYEDMYFSRVFGAEILRRSRLPLRRPLAVLDFGCGPGFLWEHVIALRARWRYTGLDFSEGSIQKLRARAGGHPQFAGAHHVARLPSELPAASFDAVLLCEVVEHLKDAWLDETLGEVARLLKPGGVCVITTPNEEDLAGAAKFCPECGAVFHEWQHVRSWSASTLVSRVQGHGLAPVFVQTLDFTRVGLAIRAVRIARRLLGRRPVHPHLLAAFRRP